MPSDIEETFEPVLCKKGLHVKAFLWGMCAECRKASDEKKRKRRKALWAQSHVRYDAMRLPPDWIPVAAIIPIIDRWLKEDNLLGDLAEGTGVSRRCIYRWRTGESKHASFDHVDRMLGYMDLDHLWYTELREFYFAKRKRAA